MWFQNRRTKHKRQKQEEEQSSRQSDHKSTSSASSGDSKHHQHHHHHHHSGGGGGHEYGNNRSWQNGEGDMPSSPISDDGSMVEIESAPESPEMAPLSTWLRDAFFFFFLIVSRSETGHMRSCDGVPKNGDILGNEFHLFLQYYLTATVRFHWCQIGEKRTSPIFILWERGNCCFFFSDQSDFFGDDALI